jgi:hypothetical protein
VPIAGADYEQAHEELAKAASDVAGSGGRGPPPAGGPAPPAYGGPPPYGAPPRGPPPPGPPGPYGPPAGAALEFKDAAQLSCSCQSTVTVSSGEPLLEQCHLARRSTAGWVWRPASWAGARREAALRRPSSETILEAAGRVVFFLRMPYSGFCMPDVCWHATSSDLALQTSYA